MNNFDESSPFFGQKSAEKAMLEILEWARCKVIETQTLSCAKKSLGVVGVANAGLGSAVVWPLGYEFGELLCDKVGITNPDTIKGLGYYFSTTATSSAVVLLAMISKKVFESKSITTDQSEKKISRRGHCNMYNGLKNAALALLCCGSAISSMPETYLTYKSFDQQMGLWSLLFSGSTLIMLTTKNEFSLENVLKQVHAPLHNKVMNKLTENEIGTIRAMRFSLLRRLQKSLKAIKEMSDDKIDQLFEQVFGNADAVDQESNQATAERIKSLYELEPRSNETESRCYSIGRNVAGFFGGAVGALSVYPFYSLSKSASNLLMDFLGVTDPISRSVSAELFGVSSIVFRGALNIYTTKDSFEKFYDYFNSLPSNVKKLFTNCSSASGERSCSAIDSRSALKSSLSILATIVSLSGGGPRVTMAAKTLPEAAWYGPVVIACAFIGGFALNFWGLQGLINAGFTGRDQRTRFIKAITIMIEMLPDLTNDHIKSLYDFVEGDNDAMKTLRLSKNQVQNSETEGGYQVVTF